MREEIGVLVVGLGHFVSPLSWYQERERCPSAFSWNRSSGRSGGCSNPWPVITSPGSGAGLSGASCASSRRLQVVRRQVRLDGCLRRPQTLSGTLDRVFPLGDELPQHGLASHTVKVLVPERRILPLVVLRVVPGLEVLKGDAAAPGVLAVHRVGVERRGVAVCMVDHFLPASSRAPCGIRSPAQRRRHSRRRGCSSWLRSR